MCDSVCGASSGVMAKNGDGPSGSMIQSPAKVDDDL
jgi:hypothetical protein